MNTYLESKDKKTYFKISIFKIDTNPITSVYLCTTSYLQFLYYNFVKFQKKTFTLDRSHK